MNNELLANLAVRIDQLEDDMEKPNNEMPTKFLVLSMSALLGLFAVTYSLLLDRINKQEVLASAEVSALREEIKTTKADAKDAVSAASAASKDAVAATAIALRESVAATALAAKDSVAASASALKDAVQATATSSKDAVQATAAALNDKIVTLSNRIDKLEDKTE